MAAPRLDPHPQCLGSSERASRTQSTLRGKASCELCLHRPIPDWRELCLHRPTPSSRLDRGEGRGFADTKVNQFSEEAGS